MVSAPLVPGILQGGQQVSSTIQMYTEKRGRGTILVAIESTKTQTASFPSVEDTHQHTHVHWKHRQTLTRRAPATPLAVGSGDALSATECAERCRLGAGLSPQVASQFRRISIDRSPGRQAEIFFDRCRSRLTLFHDTSGLW